MNPFAHFIHKTIIKAQAEEFFVRLRSKANVFRKLVPVSLRNNFPSIGRFIPNASDYAKGDNYFLTRDNTQFKIDRSDYVQWRLFYGVRDNALLSAKKFLQPGSIVLDIGANFGAFSLRLGRHISEKKLNDVQIFAYEPNPTVAKNYQNNLSLNSDLNNIIQFHPIGLGDEKGKRQLAYNDSNTGAGRVTHEKATNQTTVTIERLDDLIIKLNPPKIAFIKLIVEGFEPEVFKGGWNTIIQYKPPIFFEVTPGWWKENNSTVEEVLDKLRVLGYHFMIEHYNEMLPYEPSRFADRTQFNLLATI